MSELYKNRILSLFYSYPKAVGFGVFFIFILISGSITYTEYQLRLSNFRQQMNAKLTETSREINTAFSDATGAIKTLAYFSQNYQIESNFEEAGKQIMESHPYVDIVQVLDSGKITAVYPLPGNETVLNYDILKDDKTRDEALEAIKRKDVYFAGPIDLKQGGIGIVGRIPIYSDEEFKGFAAAIIYLDQLLDYTTFQNSGIENTLIQIKKLDSINDTEGDIFYSSHPDIKQGEGITVIEYLPIANWEISISQINVLPILEFSPLLLIRLVSAMLFGFLAYRFAAQPALLTQKIKEQSQDLIESNERFEYATMATSDVIWDWDLLTDKIYRADNFEKVLGFSKEDQLSSPDFWVRLIHPDEREFVQKNLFKTLESDSKHWQFEFRVEDKNGNYRFIIDNGYIIRDENGKAVRMIGAIQEITNRKLAELELEKEKSRLSRVIEGTGAGTWEWNIQTGETVFNEEWANIIGFRLEELQPVSIDTWGKIVHPEDLNRSNEALQAHFDGKTPFYQCEARMKHKDGHWVWVMDRGRVFSWTIDGKPELMFGTHIDISEKKAREEELEQLNVKLQATNTELKVFASVASHDMREPLRMISSFMALVQKKYADKLDPKGQQYIDFAIDGAKRLSVLIGDLLDYSRMGFDPENKEFLDTHAIVSDVIQLNQQLIQEKDAEIIVEKLPDILAIKVPIKQLFQNLIGNSLKFTKENSKPIIRIKGEEFENFCQFSVEDNGIGIEKDYLKTVFEVLKRLHAKEKYPGTGMGLAICKKIVNQHGGEVWAESTPNEKTKIFFTIPK
ncbi:PAS domain S-box-containing protein [Algoriphagus faecimaris]|uniref:histidine kinase n=1 Tax=Algoriphagus faecimaris TaxID=686796 RepID=A0A1G6WYK8_9BACT|nr:PAS domain-containing protein [Algoriphagus faecimaris]SDD70874.1 PAS domain S-box-containing protein [Algoriphagus faecimaris]